MTQRKPSGPCASCGDYFELRCECMGCRTRFIKAHNYCDECRKEINSGTIPMVTASRLAPTGTGQAKRQQYGRSKTDS